MDSRQLSVLVVEDHEFQRRLVVQMLKDLCNAVVHAAADGRAALALMERLTEPVDIVISDLAMPNMDGVAFIRKLAVECKRTALIITSAMERELLEAVRTMAEHEYGLDVVDTIEKPITPRKLQNSIDKYRTRGALMRSNQRT